MHRELAVGAYTGKMLAGVAQIFGRMDNGYRRSGLYRCITYETRFVSWKETRLG